MRRISVLVWSVSALVLVPLPLRADEGPTRVRLDDEDARPSIQSLELDPSATIQPTTVSYGSSGYPGGYPMTPEILSHIGEILGAVQSADERTRLAQNWLQYSRHVIDREQDFQQQWLNMQRQQLAQQQEADQLRYQVAQLEVRLEELRAQNLRLAQQLAAQGAGPQAPREPGQAPSLP